MTRERRQFSRITQHFEVRYRVSSELTAAWRTGTVINIGAGGMRIRSADAIAPDALVELEIQLPSTRERLALRGCVIWNRLQAAEVIEYGIAFLETKSIQQIQIDELVQFLHKSAPGSLPPS